MTQVVMSIIFRKVNEKYEFLMLKRTPKRGDFWQPIGGKVEDSDNNFLEAALRETEEESGITKENILRKIDNFYQFSYDKHYLTGEKIPVIYEYIYAFEINADVSVNIENNPSKEHDEFGWFTYKEVLKKLKWKNNKDVFKKLKEILGI